MHLSHLIKCTLGLALTLASIDVARAATAKENQEVQTLANFPILQKLAAKNAGAVRTYLSRVSESYRKASYAQFARELGQSTSLVALFGQPGSEVDSKDLKKGRSILRDLDQALAKNRRILLPQSKGETLPDYYGIAATFVTNAGVALKNISTHKNVANSLRNNKDSLWLTNNGEDGFTVTSFLGGSITNSVNFSMDASVTTLNLGYFFGTLFGTGRLVITGAGTLTLDGSNTYVGNTTITTGTLVLANPSALSGTVFLSGGTLTLEAGIPVIFPPDIEIPLNYGTSIPFTLGNAALINDVIYPAGTRIVNAADSSAILPEGAVLLPTPATITAAPTPSPTPAD